MVCLRAKDMIALLTPSGIACALVTAIALVSKKFKYGGAAWKKSESGCGAIHPPGVNVKIVKKLPCPANNPKCPNYVKPSKKQRSVASIFVNVQINSI